MLMRGAILTLMLATSLSGAAAAEAESTDTCFGAYTVRKVVPYRASFQAGQGTYEKLVGARAYVPAKPGLTGEWLHSELARRATAAQEGSQCPLHVPEVTISVSSAGPGFWVSIASNDRDDAKEVLRRAQSLTR